MTSRCVMLERGTAGLLPYVAGGSGPPVVYLGGLTPAVGVDSLAARGMALGAMAPFQGRRRVVFFNRRPGLPRGTSMADVASEHADAIRTTFGEPVDVMGMSTGGSIAQQLAADHPEVVRRLIVASSACRLGPAGKVLQRRIAARIRRGAYRQASAVMGADLVSPGRGRTLTAALAWLAGPQLMGSTSELAEMATMIEAEDDFDLAACRGTIRAPTLVIGGANDRFYGAELFAETARLIPGSRLCVIPDRGHVTATLDRRFGREIRGFLALGPTRPRSRRCRGSSSMT